jgi:aspartate carbamoyltransferase catalytic subunit
MLSKAKEYDTISMIVTYNSDIILIRNLRKDMNNNLQQVK